MGGCDRLFDERLQADKLDLLYGEADAEVRARVEAHLAACGECREELAGLSRLRRQLRAWQRPAAQPVFTPRGIVVPRWLAAAAALLLGVSLALGGVGYFSLRRSLAEQAARAQQLEQLQRQAAAALEASLVRSGPAQPSGTALDARLDEKIQESEARQARRLELRLSEWASRAEAQRRVDLARVAAGLSYLDGRHGQELARTNELMGYMLQAASQKR